MTYITANPVKAAVAIGLDHSQLATYECPYTDREYYWAMPVAFFSKEGHPVYDKYVELLLLKLY